MTDDLDPTRAPGGDDATAAELAASAWVDGVAGPAELALIESDPGVARLAARMRDVATATGEVPATDRERAERSLTAALAAFDHRDAPAPRTVGLGSTRWRPMLAVAAALLAVGVLGSVVVSGIRTSNDDSVAVAPADEAGGAEAFRITTADGDDAGGTGADDAADGAADDAAATMAAPETDPAPFEIGDAAALAAFATEVLAGDRVADGTPSPCPDVSTDVVGPATYGGVEVVIVVDGDDAVALDPGSCREVLRVELDPPPRR